MSRRPALALLLAASLCACWSGGACRSGGDAKTPPSAAAPPPASPAATFEPVRLESKEVAANYFRVDQCFLAGQPTVEGFREAKARGVKTVINLRPAEEQRDFEEAKVLESLSLRHVHIPVTIPKLDDATVETFLAAVKDSEKPILIHCGTANRVSGLWAIHLAVHEGLPAGEAIALAEKSGLRSPELKEFVRGYLARRKP